MLMPQAQAAATVGAARIGGDALQSSSGQPWRTSTSESSASTTSSAGVEGQKGAGLRHRPPRVRTPAAAELSRRRCWPLPLGASPGRRPTAGAPQGDAGPVAGASTRAAPSRGPHQGPPKRAPPNRSPWRFSSSTAVKWGSTASISNTLRGGGGRAVWRECGPSNGGLAGLRAGLQGCGLRWMWPPSPRARLMARPAARSGHCPPTWRTPPSADPACAPSTTLAAARSCSLPRPSAPRPVLLIVCQRVALQVLRWAG